ncbi:ECF transporter S component [Saliterribacillus persicus]|nr:ECF transporter S component [Saliterribacillus persicus]
MNVHRISLIAVLAALAVVGRFAFQFIPNFQPVSAIIIITGFMLGPVSAIFIAIVSTYLSNLILGMGLWTIWQIIAWSIIGLISGLLGKVSLPKPIIWLTIYSVFAGYLYGFLISVGTFSYAGEFLPYYLAGLIFDTNHAVGNGIFTVLLFPILQRLFKQYLSNSSIKHTNI